MTNFLTAVQRHGLRFLAALSLLGLTAALAWFNVTGWVGEGLTILAILAAFFEAIGFIFACLVEDAVRQRRFDRAFVAVLILVGAAAFNTVGGHRAWEASMQARVDADRQASQAALDQRRGELQLAISRAQAEIDRVPMPDPNERTGRQEQARATWAMATADARTRKAQAEAALTAMPVVAEPAPPFPVWLTWGFLGFLEVAKALGLWAIGMTSAPMQRRAPRSEEKPADTEFDASEAARRLVAMRRDRIKVVG